MNIKKCFKHTDGDGGTPERKEHGANVLSRKKKNFEKSKKKKIRELYSGHIHAHAHTRESEKCRKTVFLCMCDATEYKNIRFKAIFKPVERVKFKNGIVIGLWLKKCRSGLYFGFSCFLT